MLTLNRPPSRPSHPDPEDDADEIAETDADLDYELIALVAQLEQLREDMVAARAANRSVELMNLAQTFIDLLSGFADENCSFGSIRELEEGSNRAFEFRGALLKLREQVQGNGTFAPVAMPVAQRCFSMLVDSALSYFIAFTNRFPTSRAARPWVEVAATFVAELRQLARDPIRLP